MANLKTIEKRYFEDLFNMGSGYVLEFSNSTFAEVFRNSFNIDIYDDKYSINGNSKARRLRAFWELESDLFVGKILAELLEVWIYENPEKRSEDKYLKCRKIVQKLLGESQAEDNESEFLSKKFNTISITNINVESMLLPILEKRLDEACLCLEKGCSLATIFLCGSIFEGLLLGIAQQNPKKFNCSISAPKDKDGKVRPFQDWNLNQLINVAHEIGFLGLDIKKFGHVLRDFRNYIHPYQQMTSGFNPDLHTAEICLQVLRAAIADLS